MLRWRFEPRVGVWGIIIPVDGDTAWSANALKRVKLGWKEGKGNLTYFWDVWPNGFVVR
jgi:hypothetical protein